MVIGCLPAGDLFCRFANAQYGQTDILLASAVPSQTIRVSRFTVGSAPARSAGRRLNALSPERRIA
jgi:hypothetical protein